MTKNTCAHLRRESAAEHRGANMRENDNTENVIAYMLARGAFADYIGADGKLASGCEIRARTSRLPWNPAAPERITALVLYEHVTGRWSDAYLARKKKRPRKSDWIPAHDELRASVEIPHWDYDGIDPLIAREPWERVDAEQWLDRDATFRASRKYYVLTGIEHDAHEAECCEKLNAYRTGTEGAATFTWCVGPEG